jgi:predicted ferric reductase
MKIIQLWLAVIISCTSLMWIMLNIDAFGNTHALFAWRSLLLQYTGILAMTVMSIGILLAIRSTWLENKLNGLDKVYRLHKWLGITALVFTILHWFIFNVPKWLVQAGYYTRPPSLPRAIETVEIFKFLNSQRGLAEQIGEYAFYALVALIAIALIKRFPYRYFFMTHRWIAIIYQLARKTSSFRARI